MMGYTAVAFHPDHFIHIECTEVSRQPLNVYDLEPSGTRKIVPVIFPGCECIGEAR